MGALVAQFLEARRQQKQGVTQAMQDFVRQRRAQPWKDDAQHEVITLKTSGYTLADCGPAKIDNEATRIMTIDRQRDHFTVSVVVAVPTVVVPSFAVTVTASVRALWNVMM